MASEPVFLLLAFVGVFLVWAKSKFSKKHPNLPPSPPGDPFIGHLRLLLSDDKELFFNDLGKQYGAFFIDFSTAIG
jgi:hypothetical protein